MNNNLIIKNARIITPLGTSALKGKEMNQLLDLTGGTVKVTVKDSNSCYILLLYKRKISRSI